MIQRFEKIRLSFYVVIGHWGRFDYLKKNWHFFLVRVRTRYKLSLVFRLSPVCSKFKFMLSVGIQLFGLKTTSQGKSDHKNAFLRSGFPCEVVFRPKSWILVNVNLMQTGLSLKTTLSLYLVLTLTQKITSASMPNHHIKGQPDSSTYVRKKGASNVTQFVAHPV